MFSLTGGRANVELDSGSPLEEGFSEMGLSKLDKWHRRTLVKLVAGDPGLTTLSLLAGSASMTKAAAARLLKKDRGFGGVIEALLAENKQFMDRKKRAGK